MRQRRNVRCSTLRALLGLLTPTSGTDPIGVVPYGELAAPLREVGSMLEAAAHPARNHLRILATDASLPSAPVDEVLALVELDAAAGRRIDGFSLGMRQRLGLAGDGPLSVGAAAVALTATAVALSCPAAVAVRRRRRLCTSPR